MDIANQSVIDKLTFARRRLADLSELVSGGTFASNDTLRQQLMQEFLWHAVGATEYAAQRVNAVRGLRESPVDVRVWKVARLATQRDATDPVVPHLQALAADVTKAFPTDPWSAAGLMYRLINYRNEVTHRNTNPFHFKMSSGPATATLFLDPRDPSLGTSKAAALDELQQMFSHVEQHCRGILAHV